MNIRSWLVIAALAAAVVPLSGAGAAAGCRVNTYNALEFGDGYYLYGTAKEIWHESNGEPGLQRSASFCTSGVALPRDTCIVHSETFAALNCGANLVL